MKAMFWSLCVCVAAMRSMCIAQPLVNQGDSVSFDTSQLTDGDFVLRVCVFGPGPCNGPTDITYFAEFSYTGHSVERVIQSADAQYYDLADFGEVFNPLDSRAFTGPLPELGEVGEGDFYLGIWLPVGGFFQFQDYPQHYGWVHLAPVDGALTMIGNAMSYNSRGIIVGTTMVVPEPRSSILFSAAFAVVLSISPRESRVSMHC